MKKSILDGKRILAVDDEPDFLELLHEEISGVYPHCTFDQATTYWEAVEKLKLQYYDLVILDIMGVRGFDLLALAVEKNMKVAMLAAHALSSNALRRSIEMKAMAYLPKEKIGEIVPFLEDLLTYDYLPGWKRLLTKLKGFFDSRFESEWDKKISLNWREFGMPS